jgi:hypothetical protein
MRKMLSGSSGETFTIGKSETKTFNRTITWNSGWDINNCEIVAFVQVSPKWVLQAAKVSTKDLFVGIVDKPSTPINFELEQNYPNPFNPATTFRYSIPERSRVLLKIFDMRGKEVSTIINEVLVSGIYSEKWNPNLPSGTYIYTLEAIPIDNPKNRFFQSRKLLILK